MTSDERELAELYGFLEWLELNSEAFGIINFREETDELDLVDKLTHASAAFDKYYEEWVKSFEGAGLENYDAEEKEDFEQSKAAYLRIREKLGCESTVEPPTS